MTRLSTTTKVDSRKGEDKGEGTSKGVGKQVTGELRSVGEEVGEDAREAELHRDGKKKVRPAKAASLKMCGTDVKGKGKARETEPTPVSGAEAAHPILRQQIIMGTPLPPSPSSRGDVAPEVAYVDSDPDYKLSDDEGSEPGPSKRRPKTQDKTPKKYVGSWVQVSTVEIKNVAMFVCFALPAL